MLHAKQIEAELRFCPLQSLQLYSASLGGLEASIRCNRVKEANRGIIKNLRFFQPSKRVAEGVQSDIALERPQDGELPPSKDPRSIADREP